MRIKRNPPSTRGQITVKSKNDILRKQMELPGKELFTFITQGKTPIKEGLYLIYYDGNQADSRIKKQAGLMVVNYSEGKWGCNYTPLAYCGPLPVLSLPALKEYTPGYLINQCFYTATLEQAVKGHYEKGPFAAYIIAFLSPAKKDLFIFCFDSEMEIPYPVAKAKYRKKEDRWFFSQLEDKVVEKYTKMMESLR